MAIDKFGNKTSSRNQKKYTDDRFHTVDKAKKHHSVYLKDVYALDIYCTFNEKDQASIRNWSLVGPDKIYAGKTLEEFKHTLCTLIDKYSLKEYSDDCFYKDQVMIYTDNMDKAMGILQAEFKIENVFKDDKQLKQFTILDYFIISMVGGWSDSKDIIDIYNDMQQVMNTVFIPNGKVYITPYQYNRKKLKALNRIPSVVPKNYGENKYWRSAYFGGAAFSKRNIDYGNKIFIEYDRKSAYLYEYFMPHMSGPLKEINPDEWKRWIDNMEVTNSLGTYKIKFEMKHRLLNIFNEEVDPWELNKIYSITINLLSIDLKLFLQCADIKDIKCLTLFEYEVDMLPKAVINHIVQCFLDKELYKDLLHKKIANANYGSLCMDLNPKKFRDLKERPYYSPMWGYEIAAYARQHLYDCGKNLFGWVYSDTDSIFCRKTPENEVIINEYNMYMQKVIKKACEYYDLNFEAIKKIGLFKFETEITHFVVRGVRTYAYIDVEGNFVQKASGMCEDAHNTFEDWISDDDLDYGTKVFKKVDETGYYEIKRKCYMEPNLDMSPEELLTILMINKEEYL